MGDVKKRKPRLIERLGRWWPAYPAGTSVDPARFPEDEFPVVCLNCGYSLRALPDGKCPECGRPFERGVLLVDMYVYLRRPRADARPRISRLLFWTIAACWSSVFWGPCIPGFSTIELHWRNVVGVVFLLGGILTLWARRLDRAYMPPREKMAAVAHALKLKLDREKSRPTRT